jgi:hypothetical protein
MLHQDEGGSRVGRTAFHDWLGRACVGGIVLLFLSICAPAQENHPGSSEDSKVSSSVSSPPSASTASTPEAADVHALTDTVAELVAEIHALNSQLAELRAAQSRSDEQLRAVQQQLLLAEGKAAAASATADAYSGPQGTTAPAAQQEISATPMNSNAAASPGQPPERTVPDRVDQLEEDQEVLNSKVVEQSQTKVESGSKYRVRFSGLILFNLFENRGTVDNTDFPSIALENEQPFSPNSFGGSLRQTQLGVEVFGPNISGARTSASVNFDFAGGFPQDTINGETMGIIRLRTAVVRFDWANTSVVAGQDRLFFAPLAPTSLAVQATPALSYAGNIWSWTPQVRVEHKITISEKSSFLLQAGILDSLTGDLPAPGQSAYPSWGEQSGQPAYATRVGWSHALFGQELTLGAGGYYGRQFWGYGRNVDGWASTLDASIPLSKMFSLTGAYYRGRAVAGLWGGIGQDVVMSGSLFAPATVIKGLDSMGGWMQLKFKPRENFQINAAYGDDNPFAAELDRFPLTETNTGYLLTRNQSPFVNFIYQFRSNVEVSVEYRRLRTMVLGDDTETANHYNASLGYKF